MVILDVMVGFFFTAGAAAFLAGARFFAAGFLAAVFFAAGFRAADFFAGAFLRVAMNYPHSIKVNSA
ncbi:MAG: hypothetical protein AAF513_04115, partial [Pseudomonadota bacterium]